MRAHVYARISRDFAGEGLGVARQIEDCTRKAEALGWTVEGTFTDNDISASKSRPRPEYERLLAGIESGEVKAVVVYDLDRLTRRLLELVTFIELANKHGVALANVAGDVDLTTSNGRMVAQIKGAVAQQEADRIAERTARQKRQRAEAGKPLGTRYRTFGYSRGWEVVEAEAEIVREVFERVGRGETQGSVAEDLAGRGIRTSAGKAWTYLATSRLVRNPHYAGLATYRGEIVGKSEVPALVPEAVWQAAQTDRSGAKGTTPRKYLLSGLAICGACKAPLTGSSGRYRCDRHQGGCGGVTMRGDWIDEAVVWRVRNFYNQTRYADDEPGYDWQADVDAADLRIEALQRAYDAGDLALEDLVPMLRSERQKRSQALASAAADTSETDRITRGLTEWESADLGERRKVVGRYLQHLVVKPCGKGRQPHNGVQRLEAHWTNGKVENLGQGPAMMVF